MHNETDVHQTLRTLHRIFCDLSGHSPPYATCERRLLDFHNAGFAEDDLRLIIEHVRRENRKREYGFHLSLRFGNLVGDLERAGDLLGEARAYKRAVDHKAKHGYSPQKAEVLRASGRSDAPEVPERCAPIGEVLKTIRETIK